MFKQILHISLKLADLIPSEYPYEPDLFEDIMAMQGKAFRDVPGRKTMRIQLGDKSYFIKQHFGVGWGEIFKNLMSFKLPILGAMTEVTAIKKLDDIGIATTPLVAYGQRGYNPATLQSFVINEDLGDIVTLEELFEAGLQANIHAPSRPAILKALGELAAKLHSAGLSHRDFYLCHFVCKKAELESGNVNLHLIDLHRVLQGQPSHGAAVMKDMAGLCFSMLQIGLTAADFSVIKQYYLSQTNAFWAKVEARAQQLLTKFNSNKFQARLAKEKSAIR